MIDLAVELQFPWAIGFDGLHERILYQNRDVEHPQTCGVGFGGDEILNIRVIAAHRGHHRPAAAARAHDGAAHGVPDVHERQRPRGICRHPHHIRALGADGREIIADSPALLHRQSGLFQHIENAAHAVGDRAHDETIEQRHTPLGARPCGDAPCGQEFEILKCLIKRVFPSLSVFFNAGQGSCNTAPAVFDRLVNGGAIRLFEAVFHIPNLLCNRGSKAAHWRIPHFY